MASSERYRGYDAIVVGTGIAGMMAATDLAHRGRRVLVLEHNHQAGGLMSGIERRGFYFDVGCQSFENMGIVFPLLEQYELGDLVKFHRVRYRLKMPHIDTVVRSLEQARRDFQRAYPHMREGFDRVFDMHEKTSALIRRLFVPEAIPFVRNENPSAFAGWLARGLPYLGSLKTLLWEDFEAWYRRTLPASGVTDLLASCGYSRMNVFIASAFWHLWAEDYWYPEGGYQRMFDRWVERLTERGVEFRFKSTVTRLEKDGMRVRAVLTRKGERFSASQMVFAGDYKQAVFDLLGPEHFPRGELRHLEEAKHSDPLVSVYLGLNIPRERLREILKAPHTFYFPSYDCRTALGLNDPAAHQKAFLEITAHCLEDASLAPEGKSSVVLQAFTRCEWLDHWKSGGDWLARSAEYKELKKKVADEMIGVFEGVFPGVRDHIEYSETGSPLSAYRFTRNELGGTCGFELNWKNFPFLNPLAHTETPFENFHMAGHFTVWPGAVPTAALSGKIASVRADAKIRRGQVTQRRQGYHECQEILREHGKTFHVMAKLLGPARGRAIAAVYGFARTADDTVDRAELGRNAEVIRAELEDMKAELRLALAGAPAEPRFRVLAETIHKYGIDLYPFDDLVAGVAMDLETTRYETYEELELYCYRVAGTIGLMITPIAGYQEGSRAPEYAKTLGTAFQLTNILRDVGEDLARDRIYLPRQDLARFGLTEEDLFDHRNDAAFRAMMDDQIDRAFRLYREGSALIPLVTSRAGRLAFQFAIDAYSSILHKIRKNRYDVYTRRAYLTAGEKVSMIPRSWWSSHG